MDLPVLRWCSDDGYLAGFPEQFQHERAVPAPVAPPSCTLRWRPAPGPADTKPSVPDGGLADRTSLWEC